MRIIETETIEEPIEEYTDEQILAICCEEVDADPCFKAGERTEEMSALPQDSEYYPEETLELIEKAKEHHSGTKSDPLIVIRNEDRKNPCGEQETKYVHTGSCCDKVEPLILDENYSVDVLADNSYGYIRVSGGRLPLTVSVRGQGFYLDPNHTMRDGTIDGGVFVVYTGAACGPCKITVSDGCSVYVGTIHSVNGHWEGGFFYEILNYGTSSGYDNRDGVSFPNNPCVGIISLGGDRGFGTCTRWANFTIWKWVGEWSRQFTEPTGFNQAWTISPVGMWMDEVVKPVAINYPAKVNTAFPNGPVGGDEHCGVMEFIC